MADMKKRLETEAAVLRTIEARRRNGEPNVGHAVESQIIDRHLNELAQPECQPRPVRFPEFFLGDPFSLGLDLARGLDQWER